MFRRCASYIVIIAATAILTTVFQPFALLPTFAQPGCQTFTQTGKTVCGRFLQYWQTNGGLAQQGYPLSNEFSEVSDLNGQPYTVQYFERAVFEKHPEKAAPYDVLLSQLGTFQFQRKYSGVDPSGKNPTPAPGGTHEATATVSNPTPVQDSDVTVTGKLTRGGQPVASAHMDTTWHYKTITPGCSGVTNSLGVASCTRNISGAAIGYTVVISVVFTTTDGTTVRTSTSFTPH